ncbi:unnamed protein product [Symbiodinium necroappetens]|uniref:Uncharacterized protein n=1 Tax=Symbiodinium necroappetens TaxID=1628268 RepID=A0A812PM41_9DINO|nr:unnamed protein product [Symbiodinium necroappetens]
MSSTLIGQLLSTAQGLLDGLVGCVVGRFLASDVHEMLCPGSPYHAVKRRPSTSLRGFGPLALEFAWGWLLMGILIGWLLHPAAAALHCQEVALHRSPHGARRTQTWAHLFNEATRVFQRGLATRRIVDWRAVLVPCAVDAIGDGARQTLEPLLSWPSALGRSAGALSLNFLIIQPLLSTVVQLKGFGRSQMARLVAERVDEPAASREMGRTTQAASGTMCQARLLIKHPRAAQVANASALKSLVAWPVATCARRGERCEFAAHCGTVQSPKPLSVTAGGRAPSAIAPALRSKDVACHHVPPLLCEGTPHAQPRIMQDTAIKARDAYEGTSIPGKTSNAYLFLDAAMQANSSDAATTQVPGAAPRLALLRAVKKCCAGSLRDGNLQRVLGGRQAGLEAPLPCPHCHEQVALQPAHAQLQRSHRGGREQSHVQPSFLARPVQCSAVDRAPHPLRGRRLQGAAVTHFAGRVRRGGAIHLG